MAIAGGDLLYRCTFELFHEYKNITLGSMKMFGTIWSLLRQKFICNCPSRYIGCVVTAIVVSPEFRETVMQSDFWMVLILLWLLKGLKSVSIIIFEELLLLSQ